MKKNNIEELLKLAVRCAFTGGEIIRNGFHREKNITLKGFANPVTEFDNESEKRIVGAILKKFPAHSILTEEGLSSKGSADIKWIIDPLDGTVNFTHQIPFVCVSIGIEIEGRIEAGVIYNPILDEIYTAVKGSGAFLNKKKISVSKTASPGKSLLVTGFPYEREGRQDYLIAPLKKINENFQGFRRLGSAAMDMAYTARGSYEGFYEENLKPWDTAAGKVLIEEAGGRITDYQNHEYSIYHKTIAASNGLIHDELLAFLKDIPSPE
jgi:myo-inositol-1(or 4)-monophosphatase